MFGKRSPYRKGDVVHFVCPPKNITRKGTVIAVEKDGTLGVRPDVNLNAALMVAPGRVTQAFRKGFPL